MDKALYVERSRVKQLAMRRTIFVFPRELLPAVWPSASARVAATERAAITKDVRSFGPGPVDDIAWWLGGTNAWVNGRAVGCWIQDEGGEVRVRLLEEVSPAGRELLAAESARLTGWLGGLRVSSLYK